MCFAKFDVHSYANLSSSKIVILFNRYAHVDWILLPVGPYRGVYAAVEIDQGRYDRECAGKFAKASISTWYQDRFVGFCIILFVENAEGDPLVQVHWEDCRPRAQSFCRLIPLKLISALISSTLQI